MSRWKDAHKRADKQSHVDLTDAPPKIFEGVVSLYECLHGFEDNPGSWTEGMKMSLWMDGFAVKVALNDEKRNLVGFVTLDSNKPLLEALEYALTEASIEWKEKKPFNGGGGRR